MAGSAGESESYQDFLTAQREEHEEAWLEFL